MIANDPKRTLSFCSNYMLLPLKLGETMLDRSWKIEDAQKPIEEYTDALSNHSKEAFEPLEKGNKAKLVFSFKCDDPEVPNSEELWVEILLVQNNKYLGQLEDVPKYIKDLQSGEIIEFEERHIIDIDSSKPYLTKNIVIKK